MKKILALILILSSVLVAQTRIAAVGNSITYGYALDPSTQSYPAILQNLLGTNFQVSNFGVSSQTMLKNTNSSYWSQGAYTNSKAFLPQTTGMRNPRSSLPTT
jgi:hypothetical protein